MCGARNNAQEAEDAVVNGAPEEEGCGGGGGGGSVMGKAKKKSKAKLGRRNSDTPSADGGRPPPSAECVESRDASGGRAVVGVKNPLTTRGGKSSPASDAEESHRKSEQLEPPQHGYFEAGTGAQDGRGTAAAGDAAEATFLAGCAVSFAREDFVAELHFDHGYDIVCLFSVVKWIHLNGGDAALRTVFRKAYGLLRPGGRLVLEPQVC